MIRICSFPGIFLLLALTVGSVAQAQTSRNDFDYPGSGHPQYWQHRRPDGAYWQQDVHYTIDARVDETENVIDAGETLDYWNHSPDTLTYVYFHLYQNAFVKGSYLHDLEHAKKVKTKLGKYEAAGLGTVVEDLCVRSLSGNGDEVEKDSLGRWRNVVPVRTELDNSILKVYLPKPLYPGQGVRFSMNFKTYYDRGSTRRRMQMYPAWGFMHYNGCQWFPKIAVYDRKFGWDTYQHLNKEFYGDFGIYDVSLNFPSNYVVEATGMLQNRDEVLPKELRDRLDLKNFAAKKWNEAPSTVIPYEKGKRKTWKYHAENVHDFAFTADPSYRIGTAYWNGIECVAIAQEPHAAGWQNGADYVAKVIRTFSEDIGMYQYPKMVAADANDGMEYPMLTLDGGRDPSYHSLLVHEIGHNWFYGMVGSNETYRAAMDEGFTQFLTAWGLNRIDGDVSKGQPRSWYRRLFYTPPSARGQQVYNAYLYDALNRNELPLNTHSNDFHDALGHEGGYRQVYFKTATMLYNLQYTLGDSLFLKAMQHYFDQWKFAHPYFEDFRSSIIGYTKTDLNWFFDEWLETTKTIDYGIGRIKKIPGTDSFAVRLKRKSSMQMPVDFTVTAKDGQRYSFYVPNTWFVKSTDAAVLRKWYGWGKLENRYDARIQVPGGIRNVQLDTTARLADMYALNNYKTRGLPWGSQAFRVRLDGGLNPTYIDRRSYNLYLRPDLWWNLVDGIKAGVHVEGNYMSTMHQLDATVWFNTHVLQGDQYLSTKSQGYYEKYLPVSYSFNYLSPLSRNIPRLQLQVNSRILDGLNYHRAGVNWLADDNNTLQLYGQTMWRTLRYDLDYLLYPNEWSSMQAHPNSSLNIRWNHKVSYVNGNGLYSLSARAPFFAGKGDGAFNYSYAQLEAVNYNHIGRLEVRTRLFGRYGTGSVVPQESALWLAGADPEEMMENKYTRSVGIVPDSWEDISRYETNHFQQGGGLNLRGYAGYFVADERNGEVLIGYKGRSGFSGNVEVDVDDYIPLHPKLTRNWLHADLYGFADAGMIELSRYSDVTQYWKATPANELSDLRVDAGVGIALTVKNWGPFEKARPLTLRFDVPLFLNRPPYANPQYAAFRYVVGINRSF